jgi:hypothetical protein
MTAPKLNASPAAQAAFNAIYNKIARANPGSNPQAIGQAAMKYLANQGYRSINGKIVTPGEAAAYVRQVQAAQRKQNQPQHRPPAKKGSSFGSGGPGIWAMGKRLL